MKFVLCRRALLSLFLLAWAVVPAQAQWAVGTLKSVDQLLNDARYVLRMAGKEDLVSQMDGFLSAYLGKGIDTKRPIGFFMNGFGDRPPVVAFVPVTGESDFVDFLAGFGLTVGEPDKDGLRSIDTPFGPKLHLKFQHKYVFAAEDGQTLAGNLPDPATLMTQAGKDNLIAFSVRIDKLPAEAKQEFFKKLDEEIGNEMKKQGDESDAQHQARMVGMKLVTNLAKQLATEGREFNFTANVDQSLHQFTLDVAFSAQPGTKLASQIDEFGAARSTFSRLTLDAAGYFFVKLPIPAELRKELNTLIDKGFQEALNQEQSQIKKAIAEKVFQTLEPSLKSDSLDVMVALNGPSDAEKFTLLAALKVKDGQKIEALVRDLLQQMPEAERKKAQVKLDRAKVGSVNIHSFLPPEKDEKAEKIFGNQEVFVAFRDDAVLLTLGAGGEAQLKSALEAMDSPGGATKSVPMLGEAAVAKLGALDQDNDHEKFAKAAKEAFKGPRQDRIRMLVSGTKGELHLRVEASTYLVKLIALMAE